MPLEYRPTVVDYGYGEGIADGAKNFANLFSQGMQQKRAEDMQKQQWARQDARDEKMWQREDQRQNQQWNRQDSKELASKQEEADFSAAAWDALKSQMPEVISPEMDDKFHSGSLGSKRGLLNQAMTFMARETKRQDAEANRFDPASAAAYPIPGAPDMGLIYDKRGRGGMMVRLPSTDYGPISEQGNNSGLWDGGGPVFTEPANPNFFQNMQMPSRPSGWTPKDGEAQSQEDLGPNDMSADQFYRRMGKSIGLP